MMLIFAMAIGVKISRIMNVSERANNSLRQVTTVNLGGILPIMECHFIRLITMSDHRLVFPKISILSLISI